MATILEELLAPIAEGNFCGEDPGYESEFESAKQEMEKVSGNDFALIEGNCHKVLTTKSKDMRVLGFYCLAVAMTRGLDAFGQAVQAYGKILEEHWDNLHPRRAVARGNALKWLNGDRVISLLEGVNGSYADYQSLQGAHLALENIKRISGEKFPEGIPSFANFYKIVKEFLTKYEPLPEPAAEAQSSGGGTGVVSSETASVPSDIQSAGDCEVWVQKAAHFLLEQNRADVIGYRLMRIIKWGNIATIQSGEDSRTFFPAPNSQIMDMFRSMFESRDWQNLVQSAEEAFTSDEMVLWLDLQRYLCGALSTIGGENTVCAQAIMREVALLVQRVPSIQSLQFDDGTAFADALTRDWIQSEVLASMGVGGPAPVKKKGDVGEETQKAAELLASGKLDEALRVLRIGLSNDSNARNNFERKWTMADLCFKAGRPQLAQAILEELEETIEKHGLAGWEPELCLSVYGLLHKVYSAVHEGLDEDLKGPIKARAIAILTKISRLDPVFALISDFK